MRSTIFCILLLCFCSACVFSPQPVYKLSPQDREARWLNGKQYLISEKKGVTIALAYERELAGNYIFNVEIMNMSDGDFMVLPNSFSYSYKTNDKIKKVHAVNPEGEILKAYKLESIEYANYESIEANNSVIFFLDIIRDIASMGKTKTAEELDAEKRENAERKVKQLENELAHEKRIKSINNVVYRWEKKALRKTTLPPGYKIRGDIHFPLSSARNRIQIMVETNNGEMAFPFTVTEIQVSR